MTWNLHGSMPKGSNKSNLVGLVKLCAGCMKFYNIAILTLCTFAYADHGKEPGMESKQYIYPDAR
jgi:hypothetical protein